MSDSTLVGLCKSVSEGSLTTVGPLLDRLLELGDQRAFQLSYLTGELIETTSQLDSEWEGASRRRRTAEELAFRRDESSFRAWRQFMTNFQRLFWLELSGKPALEELQRVESLLNTPKQASRRNEVVNEDDNSDVMEDGAGYTPLPRSFPSGLRRLDG